MKKPFSDSWTANIGATLSRATEVNPGTSSQATSNFSNSAWVNPGENVASPSNGSIKQRLSASLTWQHNFFGDYATAVTAFYDGHTGNPYSWTFGNDANGDSISGFDPAYIPAANDPKVAFAAGTSPAVIQQFEDFLAHDKYLSGHRGMIAGRNSAHLAWANQLDLSFAQEVPGIWGKGEVRFDIFNFLNLLNNKWGEQQVAGLYNTRSLVGYGGVNSSGQYVYTLPTDKNGNYQPQALAFYDGGFYDPSRVVSRWSVMVTLRYKF